MAAVIKAMVTVEMSDLMHGINVVVKKQSYMLCKYVIGCLHTTLVGWPVLPFCKNIFFIKMICRIRFAFFKEVFIIEQLNVSKGWTQFSVKQLK